MRDADIRERLAAFGALPDDKLSIAEAALWLAKRDLATANIGSYLHHLRVLADDVATASRGVDRLRGRVACLREVLFRQHKYVGDAESYDDLQNANLMRVIDRRKGLPVALGILAVHAARRQGWDICGLNFPGHFLLRVSLAGESVIVDPFERLRRLTAEELRALLARVHGRAVPLRAEFIRRVSDREILLRLQNNIKSRALASGDMPRAFDVLDSMVLIAPGNAGLNDELATLRARLKGKLN
jgi:regulator of sirC expression with transglutaminase-like and TPR domain